MGKEWKDLPTLLHSAGVLAPFFPRSTNKNVSVQVDPNIESGWELGSVALNKAFWQRTAANRRPEATGEFIGETQHFIKKYFSYLHPVIQVDIKEVELKTSLLRTSDRFPLSRHTTNVKPPITHVASPSTQYIRTLISKKAPLESTGSESSTMQRAFYHSPSLRYGTPGFPSEPPMRIYSPDNRSFINKSHRRSFKARKTPDSTPSSGYSRASTSPATPITTFDDYLMPDELELLGDDDVDPELHELLMLKQPFSYHTYYEEKRAQKLKQKLGDPEKTSISHNVPKRLEAVVKKLQAARKSHKVRNIRKVYNPVIATIREEFERQFAEKYLKPPSKDNAPTKTSFTIIRRPRVKPVISQVEQDSEGKTVSQSTAPIVRVMTTLPLSEGSSKGKVARPESEEKEVKRVGKSLDDKEKTSEKTKEYFEDMYRSLRFRRALKTPWIPLTENRNHILKEDELESILTPSPSLTNLLDKQTYVNIPVLKKIEMYQKEKKKKMKGEESTMTFKPDKKKQANDLNPVVEMLYKVRNQGPYFKKRSHDKRKEETSDTELSETESVLAMKSRIFSIPRITGKPDEDTWLSVIFKTPGY